MSGKPCVGVCRQGIVGRAEVGLSEGKHAYLSFPLCGSIWPTSQTYVSNGCGLHGGMRGGDVSSYEKVVPMNFNRQQNATWVTVTPRSSVLPFGLSRITGRANTYSRWEERGEHSGSRMHMGSTEGEELQELSLFSLAKVSPASAAPPPSGKYKNDLTSSPCHASLLAHMVGLFPGFSVSTRKCCLKPCFRSTKEDLRARGQWLLMAVLAFLQPLEKAP